MSTPPVSPHDASVPPLPAPADAAPAPRRRRISPILVAIPVGVVVGTLGAAHKMPFDPAYSLLFGVGVLGGVSVFSLLSLLLAGFSGLAPVYASVGAGRWLGSTTAGGRLLAVRMLPVVLVSACLVITDRPDLPRLLRRGTVVQALVMAAVCAALIAAGGPATALGLGLAVVTVLIFAAGAGKVTSPAWRLWRMRSGTAEAELGEWRVDPVTLEAARAAALGRVDLMRAALDGAPPSGSPRRQAMRISLLLAEGRTAEAAREALDLRERSQAPSLRTAALQLYACAVSDGVHAGVWPPQEALPHFAAALATLRGEVRAAGLRGTDLGAREALFQGRPDRAVALASLAASMAPEALSRAGALHTLAVAHAAAGHPREAARAAAKSAELVRL